jgi:transposase
MNDNERKIRARENWLKTYQNLGSITKASRKLGVSRSTLYRWINRYNQEGKSGLSDKSRRPKNLVNQKVDPQLEIEILSIRKKRLGALPENFCSGRVSNLTGFLYLNIQILGCCCKVDLEAARTIAINRVITAT